MSEIDPQEFGALTAKVDSMQREIDGMRDDIKTLVAMAERSRGALWAGMTLAGLFGGLITWVGGKLFGGGHP